MSEERTEAPTPKRREEVRKRGQTSRSHDLTGAVVLLAGLYGLKLIVTSLHGQLTGLVVGSILSVGTLDPTARPSGGMAGLEVVIKVLPPFFGLLALAALASTMLQGGFTFAPNLLAPKAERVNPIAGFKRIVSAQGLVQGAKTLLKFAVVALVGFLVIRGRLPELARLGALDLMPAVGMLLDLVWELLFKSAIALLLVGVADWLWERRRFLQSLRMTKQEVKEEFRQQEGDPNVRAQVRRKRDQMHQQMMKNVRTADVVITNPTHIAVALKYDPVTMAAPVVVAKGQDFLAQRIKEVAAEAGIPLMENKPLARSLYKLVAVGGMIPVELYLAVAEVLAFVFRLRAERTS
jgi:flagellar biosynthetic protein FlhB